MTKFKKFYKNKKILVTGATGFKGAWLTSWLLELGAKVIGSGFNPNENKNLFYQLNLQKKINLKIFDLRDFNKLSNLIKRTKPSIVFHLAAQPLIHVGYSKPYDTFDINFKGTLNVLEVTRKYKFIKSVVIVTSDKCYESNNSTTGFKETDVLGGIDPYSASKASIELMTRAYRESFFSKENIIGVSTARAGNVIGGGDWSTKRLIPDVIRSLIKNSSSSNSRSITFSRTCFFKKCNNVSFLSFVIDRIVCKGSISILLCSIILFNILTYIILN